MQGLGFRVLRFRGYGLRFKFYRFVGGVHFLPPLLALRVAPRTNVLMQVARNGLRIQI